MHAKCEECCTIAIVLVIGFVNLKPTMDSTLIGSVHNHNNNDKGDVKKIRPFPTPIVGKKYEIFQPLYDIYGHL